MTARLFVTSPTFRAISRKTRGHKPRLQVRRVFQVRRTGFGEAVSRQKLGVTAGLTSGHSISQRRAEQKSKYELQRELELTREGGRRCNDATRGAVLGARENNLIREREIGVIENIEHLGPE